MTTDLTPGEARRLLVWYHLQPGSIPEIFARLRTIQYDPLNPVGRNPDLVLQARVPGYRVHGWQDVAYGERLIYDAWDKQACLVPVTDWPYRATIRERYQPWHDRSVLDEHPEAVAAALTELDARGPLSSLEFEDRVRVAEGHSWLGPTRIKRILRALWARGDLVTHHREGGRHYYDRPERVLPPHVLTEPVNADEFHHWIVLQRHQAAGLLRPTAEAAIWSATGDAQTRNRAIGELVERGDLIPFRIGKTLYHAPGSVVTLLNAPALEPRVAFLAPLDNMLWDRRAVRQIFEFDYVWEVYKPESARLWGYYVLPVLYGDRFVARIDSRLEGTTWSINRWWWEEGVKPTPELLDAISVAAKRFKQYLGATEVVATVADRRLRSALSGTRRLGQRRRGTDPAEQM